MERLSNLRKKSAFNAYNLAAIHLPPEAFVNREVMLRKLLDPRPDDLDYFKGARKYIGRLAVDPGIWNGPYLIDYGGEFQLVPDRPVLEIHLPPVRSSTPFLDIKDSFAGVADFMIRINFKPDFVFGFTYERLARAARIAGFRQSDIPVPHDKSKTIAEMYEVYKNKGLVKGEMGEVRAIYQSYIDFMNRFGFTNNT